MALYKADGTQYKYYYDTQGNRVRKDEGVTEYYVLGTRDETEAVVKADGSQATHNIYGKDNLGQVKRSNTTWARYYYLKDHLGSVRVIVNSSGAIDSYLDYYPFGMTMDGRNGSSSADPRYKFTGKEWDTQTGYDYFGARYYDGRVGKWLQVDPLADGFPSFSPYTYTINNPIAIIDPDGRDTLYFNSDGRYSGQFAKGGENIALVRDEKGNVMQSFEFLDVRDMISIRDNVSNVDGFDITGIDLKFAQRIDDLLNRSGVNDKVGTFNSAIEKMLYVIQESQPLGKMDYVSKFGERQYETLKAIEGRLYNNFDAGNYLWGAGMNALGFKYATAWFVSQLYSQLKYGKPDAYTDQMAIIYGYQRN